MSLPSQADETCGSLLATSRGFGVRRFSVLGGHETGWNFLPHSA